MIRLRFYILTLLAAFQIGVCYGAIVDVRVISGLDDAEQHINEGNFIDLTSSDLELGAEGGGADIQEIGIRFQSINIPSGSTIDSAFIQFTVDELDDENTSVRFFGQLSPDPLQFSAANFDISSRPKTTSFVDWNNIPVWDVVGEAGPNQRSPDLASVVQEIVNQSGWTANNSMAFIITSTGGERTAESFDGQPTLAPRLIVNFTAIPEPTSVAVLGIAVLGFGFSRRRRTV